MRFRRAAAVLAAAGGLGCAGLATAPFSGLLSPVATPQGVNHVAMASDLAEANYRVVRVGMKGESQGFVLLFFFQIRSPSLTEAVDQLYAEAALEPGGAWALANVVVEREARSLLLFARPRVRVRADVVEFVPRGVVELMTPVEPEGEPGGAGPEE